MDTHVYTYISECPPPPPGMIGRTGPTESGILCNTTVVINITAGVHDIRSPARVR